MSLKKYLKSKRENNSGQAIVEYFILLVLLATLTVLGSRAFFGKVQATTDRFESAAFDKMNPPVSP
jgi:hypothetical protein